MKSKSTRRSGIKIMASLVALLGSLAYIMLLAVINGSLGFICAMGVTLFGTIAIAKALGEAVAISYSALIILTVLCGVMRGILRYFEQYSNHYIAFKLLAVLRDRIFGALRRLCPAKFETKQRGSIISMITSDIETLEVFYAHTLSPICIAITVSVSVLIFVSSISSIYLALTALFGYITVGVILPMISSSVLKDSGVRYRAEFASFNAFFLDSIKGVREIVLNNASDARRSEVDRRSDVLISETKTMKRGSSAFSALTEVAISLSIVLTLVTGIVLVRTGSLSIGRTIIGVVAVFGSFGPVIAISALPSNLTQTFASGDRVLDLLSEEPAVAPVRNGLTLDINDLTVKDLSFSYGDDDGVLEGLDLHAQVGEIVGIVGESGCGKSTLLKLLMRFWQKDSGSILYNGHDIDTIETESLLKNVTMVSQSTYLFDKTIEENLRIAKPDATYAEIEAACRCASVHELIASLPNGYKTHVGALGRDLSAGERQRIGLARAFLRGSAFILLDEPTSNVDSINEGIILASLAEHKKDKCIILVSHRESTMAIADRVYRIQKGRIYEERDRSEKRA